MSDDQYEIPDEIRQTGSDVPADPPREHISSVARYRSDIEVPPEFANLSQGDLAVVLAEQAERLAQPAGNVDVSGAPHFLRNVDGVEVCGQDGQSWPCDQVATAAAGQAAREGLTPASQPLPTMAEAAKAAGLDLAEFEERLRQTRGL